MQPPPVSMFDPYLLPRERVLWTGRPKQGLAFHGTDWFMVPFSLLWMGMVIWFSIMALNGQGSLDLILIIFLVVGIYFTVGRFIHDALIRRSLSYAVSNERILFARRSGKLTSHDINRLPILELEERGDGTGSIRFERERSLLASARKNDFSIWIPSLAFSTEFFRIDHPRTVYDLIRQQSANA